MQWTHPRSGVGEEEVTVRLPVSGPWIPALLAPRDRNYPDFEDWNGSLYNLHRGSTIGEEMIGDICIDKGSRRTLCSDSGWWRETEGRRRLP